MCPQPASKVIWNGNYVFGSDVLINKSNLGSIVAAVIAGWSVIEAHLGRTFANLIGAKQPVAMEMYAAVRAFDIQNALLRAAAREVLPDRYAEMLEASLVVIKNAASERNKFAHHIWGASADPALDALFLVEPRHWIETAAEQHRFWNRKDVRERKGPLDPAVHGIEPKIKAEHIMVYLAKDLIDARERIEHAFRVSETLRGLVLSEAPIRRLRYLQLRNQPDVLKALNKLRKARGRKPLAPPKPQEKDNQK